MLRSVIVPCRWVVLLWALAACTPPASSADSGRAGLVVGYPDGSFATTCVDFEGAEVSGEELLRSSGIPVAMDRANPMGPMVCSIGGEGCDFPSEGCLCACRGTGGCSYWAYLNWRPPDGWSYGVQGAGQRRLSDGDMDAWIWLERALPGDDLPRPPAEFTFDTVCD